MSRSSSLATRWLGVGLASLLAVLTLGLGLTGRLGLYINPDSAWWAMSMSVVVLLGGIASCALPLGAEADHGHDHGEHGRAAADEGLGEGERVSPPPLRSAARRAAARASRPVNERSATNSVHPLALAVSVAGGVVASGIVVTALVLPPATLSAELAMSRDIGATPLFAGADVVTLAATGDTASFGVGEWATVFATATSPEAFDGEAVKLTGFATPSESGDFTLTRLIITHCVIDAQPAGLPVATGGEVPATGQWVDVTGVVRATADGRLVIEASSIEPIDEPGDPYEY